MISLDKAALICDLAETYGVYDYRSLPVQTVATFSAGLRENSRIKKKLNGETVSVDTLLLGMIYDNISRVLVALGAIEEPKFITDVLMGEEHHKTDLGYMTFTDADSFEEQRNRIIKGIKNGGN